MSSICRSTLMLISTWLCLIQETEAKVDYNSPLLPDAYQKEIGQGFAVKYFSKESTTDLLKGYSKKNIQDLYDAGFRNVRLRCGAAKYGNRYNTDEFSEFLNDLDIVVTDCLNIGVVPIVSWEHAEAEAYATEKDRENYIDWWERVASQLKDKDYRLGFNLVSELGAESCRPNCEESLKYNNEKYIQWMAEVVDAIRKTGGNNKNRILILGPPYHSAEGLAMIDGPKIYGSDSYMMAEYHMYATSYEAGSDTNWKGCGNQEQRQTLHDQIALAKTSTDLKTYWGAWRVQDNNQREAECFAEFFVKTLKEANTPWSLNTFDIYYNTKKSEWITGKQENDVKYDKVLDVIKKYM